MSLRASAFPQHTPYHIGRGSGRPHLLVSPGRGSFTLVSSNDPLTHAAHVWDDCQWLFPLILLGSFVIWFLIRLLLWCTDRYLHFSSHHPVSAKTAAVRSPFDRVRNVTLQKENLREEENFTTTFKQNGYPPYPSSVPSPLLYRNHQHHQRRSRMRNQMTKDPRRMRRNNYWQSFHT